MAWFNFFTKNTATERVEKLNPAQPLFTEKVASSREPTLSYEQAYEQLEIVNRSVNMLVDDASEINIKIGDKIPTDYPITSYVHKSKINKLLNFEPNPFQDISTFRRNMIIDLIIDGNIFLYWDGAHLYHLPAAKVHIHASDTTYVKKYTFNEKIDYYPSEIIHIKENSFYSIYRGTSRLKPALRTMRLMISMRNFQDNFFRNGAIPGLVLKSPNTLSDRVKIRMAEAWQQRYSPESGGRRPLILDGGLEVDELSKINFKDLDFQNGISDNEKIILKAIGVPPILLDSGNNANIRPNMRLYYLETVLPITTKINRALERFFGHTLVEDLTEIPALQPELRDQSQYFTSLVNAGIITPNEAREQLNFNKLEDCDDIRVPANIAGSATNPEEGGRPTESEET